MKLLFLHGAPAAGKLTVAGILRYAVTPQIVAKFEAIEAALKRLPGP